MLILEKGHAGKYSKLADTDLLQTGFSWLPIGVEKSSALVYLGKTKQKNAN